LYYHKRHINCAALSLQRHESPKRRYETMNTKAIWSDTSQWHTALIKY